jgi:ADP-ribose pyrophosphatase
MKSWKTIQTHERYHHDHTLTVEAHQIELPDGQLIENWPWLKTPDYTITLPVDRQGRCLIFRQTKYAVQGTSLAMVGGYLEPGEEPWAGAQRELLEETGCQADTWIPLGSYAVDGNRGNGRAHLFLALGAEQVQAVDADDLEEQELLHLTRAEVQDALDQGEFKVLAWALDAALALQYMERHGSNGV